MEQLALVPQRVYRIEADIESLYHNHFTVQRRDQKLADLTGVEFVRLLRGESRTAVLPVLMLSEDVSNGLESEARRDEIYPNNERVIQCLTEALRLPPAQPPPPLGRVKSAWSTEAHINGEGLLGCPFSLPYRPPHYRRR